MHIIIDGRGKKMVSGGRYRAAQQARFLRRSGAGNAAAMGYIASAASAYATACSRDGWTAGQGKHSRLVTRG